MERGFQRYWIFQGMPERYDLEEHLVPGNPERWVLSRYREDISVGDFVYFWRGGRQPGFFGWGEVTGLPEGDFEESEDHDVRVPVLYQERFEKPFFKNELTSKDEESGALAGLLVLRAPQGANFKVTTQEAIALNGLLRQRGDEPPPDPPGTSTREYPAQSLLPLNFGRSVKRVFGAALRTRPTELTGTDLFEALIAFTNSSYSPPRGVASLLMDYFSSMSITPDMVEALSAPLLLSPADLEGSSIDVEALNISEAARLLAIQSTGREQIGVRHLTGAFILVGTDGLLDKIEKGCADAGHTLLEFVNKFGEFTIRNFGQDDSSAWLSRWQPAVLSRLESRAKKTGPDKEPTDSEELDTTRKSTAQWKSPLETDWESEAVEKAFARAFSGRPLTDRPTGHDLLMIGDEVKALAHLFAQCTDSANTADSKQPENSNADLNTFALGLFGRWGAGKSFFIEKLKEQIEKFSMQDGKTYCKDIVQIDFNAWHYNEADIWASLVHHIFDQLQRHFAGKEQEKEFKNLISELESTQQRRAEIKGKLTQKNLARTGIQSRISEKESRIDKNVENQLTKISALGEAAVSADVQEKFSGLLSDAADLLGLPESLANDWKATGKSARELLASLKETGALAAKTHSTGSVVMQSVISSRFIVGMGVALLIYALAWHWKPDFMRDVPSIGQGIAAATAALAWIKVRLSKANSALDRISGMEASLRDEVRRQEEQKDEELVTLRLQHAQIEKEIEQDKERLEDVDREIRYIENQLADLGSPESLLDFINDRAASDDYREKLGILALIRSDFEKLSTLMTGRNRKPDKSGKKLPHLDRIILYIDDLDRVQESSKVLRVLEAVHLLLAFPLFHVVVAVDERWAARSVKNHHYQFFRSLKNANDVGLEHPEDPSLGAATPREFLEKIFQICFWVRPLTTQLSHELINGIVRRERTPFAPNLEVNKAWQAEDDSTDLTSKDAGSLMSDEPDQSPSGIESGGTDEPFDQEAPARSPGDQPSDHTPLLADQQEILDDDDNGESDDRDAEQPVDFAISEEELISMRAVSRIIGRSPRTVKRFINTYGIFKAMRIQPGTGAITSEPFGSRDIERRHVPIMILLAIQIGHPDVAFLLFKALDEALEADEGQTIGEVIKNLEKDIPENAVAEKWQGALDSIKSVHGMWGENPKAIDVRIAALDDWLVGTSRFGFKEWVPKANRLWE